MESYDGKRSVLPVCLHTLHVKDSRYITHVKFSSANTYLDLLCFNSFFFLCFRVYVYETKEKA